MSKNTIANKKQNYLVQPALHKANVSGRYKVVSECCHLEVWATGFYGEQGRKKAQGMIDEGYFHRFMYEADKHKKLIVVSE